MLQIDHLREFYSLLFKNKFEIHMFENGTISDTNYKIFTGNEVTCQILFYDQEPLVPGITEDYLTYFRIPFINVPLEELKKSRPQLWSSVYTNEFVKSLLNKYEDLNILVTSEHSQFRDDCVKTWNLKHLYYFYHAFAAFDWYRGFNVLNADKNIVKTYTYDYISFNRLIANDRSYRIYFVSKLAELGLLSHGQVSFGLETGYGTWKEEVRSKFTKLSLHAKDNSLNHLSALQLPLVIDKPNISGNASADIAGDVNDCFWHIVTETVFYYNKLHLTEKIFKPIVSKQPFMLLAAPGNLEYLRSYGFKTFDGIIDESYDKILDNDQRVDAVVKQLHWYCNLSVGEKRSVIEAIVPIVEYNFCHFYGEFKHIVTRELLNNTKDLFKEIGYDDRTIAYDQIYQALTN